MRENRIFSSRKRKFRITTDSEHRFPVAENLLERDFGADSPDRKWVTDITYIPTREGWLYLAVVLDLYSRRIVGWSMGERLEKQLAIKAMMMALKQRLPRSGLLHHSDRGAQYASNDYRELLEAHSVLASMSRRGDCWDNAVAESFFKTLKVERVYQRKYETRMQAQEDIFQYIEVFYNRKRRHSAIGFLSPVDFERINMAA
jgi:transposase InsO family protein